MFEPCDARTRRRRCWPEWRRTTTTWWWRHFRWPRWTWSGVARARLRPLVGVGVGDDGCLTRTDSTTGCEAARRRRVHRRRATTFVVRRRVSSAQRRWWTRSSLAAENRSATDLPTEIITHRHAEFCIGSTCVRTVSVRSVTKMPQTEQFCLEIAFALPQ